MKKVDIVIHAAAKVPNSKTTLSNSFHENNVFGTLNLLDYCVHKKIKKLIFISSYVYGNPKHNPIRESHIAIPHNEYTKSKFISEELCRTYSKLYDLHVIILRPFNIFGPSQKSGYLIPNLIHSLNTNKKITIVNKKSKRDFLFIDDFVNAISKILKKDFKFAIFNIGSGTSYSFEEIVKKLENLSSLKLNVEYVDDKNSLIPKIQADISQIKKNTNWIPKTTIDSGLQKLIK